ncbi:MerR family transcriptional regulator [Streptomyces lunaelactis]|uniref:MerR family transcriptional regulator n=1 Tax=Streptomyces lunaelactis TaxID=1535768 RepID=A0A2R4T468_9ACTN|nr:MerR family transcriptional regulator [Streptomyces lunaelactis]AVZ73902.1 MerR family transcriptional regulator [Streptomyces lunaelactis]NUK88231.1 MerR family transcriptional regulator [Streptomyces lunaelactis]NUL04449.1 MerR family transcriptional regulator [Streptomyces lunaelactis]
MEWSIQEIARRAGTTSRTLRHYGELGLLEPSRVGSNGYRYYDQDALVRLQRILLLRELGLPLPAIAEVLEGQRDTAAALRTHLALLEQERVRIGRQIASVRTTLHKTEEGEELMAEEVLDGFDHTQYEREVTERWGREAYEKGDRWWRSLSARQKREFQEQQVAIAQDFAQALKDGKAAGSDEVQAITRRQYEWLSITVTPTRSYFTGLGEMYVADPRFTVNYDRHGEGTAAFVRDAMKVYGERHLTDG